MPPSTWTRASSPACVARCVEARGAAPLIRLAVRADARGGEAVLAALLELVPEGLDQREGPGWVEYGLYGERDELPRLPGELGGWSVQLSEETVAGDWAERWRTFHRPVLIAERLYVRQPWEAPLPDAAVPEVVVDPGQAFGTGSHASTRGCLELLLGLEAGGPFRDLGCGSGVLAIAAAKLGFGPVSAVDSDPAAVAATRTNAELNGVRLDRVEVADAGAAPLPVAGVVAANLVRELLLALAAVPGRPELLILSGLLEREADEVVAAWAPARERRRLTREGWTSVLLESPDVVRST